MRVTNKINSLEANSTNNQVTTPSMRKQRRQLIVMLSVLSSSLFIAILLQVAARPKLTGAQANPSDHATGTGINDTSSTSEPVGSSSDQVVPGSTATTSQTSSVTTSRAGRPARPSQPPPLTSMVRMCQSTVMAQYIRLFILTATTPAPSTSL
jgi:hypothetical protein